MSEHGEPKDDISMLEKMGYECRDMAVESAGKYIVFYGGIFTVAMIALSFLVMQFYDKLNGTNLLEPKDDPRLAYRRMPPEGYPLLQSNRTAHGDTIDLKKKEKEVLHTYGESDQAPGTFRVPVSRAIQSVAEQGLPTRPNAVSDKDPQ